MSPLDAPSHSLLVKNKKDEDEKNDKPKDSDSDRERRPENQKFGMYWETNYDEDAFNPNLGFNVPG